MITFENKKILLICKETFSYPLYFLAKRWIKNNNIAAYFIMPAECMYNQTHLNLTTYYAFKKQQGITLYDVKDISLEFTQKMDSKVYDLEYLEYIEKNYTHFKELNIQLMSSQLTSTYYHNRKYMKEFTFEQRINWLLLNYKNVEYILDDYKPDVIIDCDDAELPRSIINEVAFKKNIPYITIDHPRYNFFKLYTYHMGIGIDNYFKEYYYKAMSKDKNDLAKEYEEVDNYRKKNSIMPEEYKNTITSQYDKDDLISTIKCLLGKIIYFYNQDVKSKNRKLKNSNQLIFPSTLEYLKFYFRVEIIKRYLYSKNKFFSDPIDGEKYVYMPLHLIPESTTFVKAPFYVNELSVIEAVSKALPIGWKLYVKEHQAMLGERSLEFYRNVNKLPNVRLVSINYYKDPKPWIINAQGVITITGTSAYEAAMLGKRAIVFGDVPFALINSITRIHSFENLSELIKEFKPVDNIHSCASYIYTVKNLGFDFKFKYIMDKGYDIINNNCDVDEEFMNQLNILEKLYITAYENYK